MNDGMNTAADSASPEDTLRLGELRNAFPAEHAGPSSAGEEENWRLLVETMAARVLAMLRDRPQKLFSALYMLDVPERACREALAAGTLEEQARSLAELILLREAEKEASRRRYARQTGFDGDMPRELPGGTPE